MLTEEETNDMHAMVTEFEATGKWFRLRALAELTGDAWEALVRQYLAERRGDQS